MLLFQPAAFAAGKLIDRTEDCACTDADARSRRTVNQRSAGQKNVTMGDSSRAARSPSNEVTRGPVFQGSDAAGVPYCTATRDIWQGEGVA